MPLYHVQTLKDGRLITLLLNHHILEKKNIGAALMKLRIMKDLGDRSLSCDGRTVYEVSADRANKISGACPFFLFLLLLLLAYG
jgi:hypothetical protein